MENEYKEILKELEETRKEIGVGGTEAISLQQACAIMVLTMEKRIKKATEEK